MIWLPCAGVPQPEDLVLRDLPYLCWRIMFLSSPSTVLEDSFFLMHLMKYAAACYLSDQMLDVRIYKKKEMWTFKVMVISILFLLYGISLKKRKAQAWGCGLSLTGWMTQWAGPRPQAGSCWTHSQTKLIISSALFCSTGLCQPDTKHLDFDAL